ncbi:MAG: hypothetical protein HYT75_08600 [Deltaproteobacteria bacterium]|nr:hypothetical protein [Deltaproteobacteria bacterium]MBI2341121.1 hypothetical protein [Deltaproteobacteria bacterium]
MSNSVRKYALVINGSSKPFHLENLERSAKILAGDGYSLYVVNPKHPRIDVDQYVEPKIKDVRLLIRRLSDQIDNNDELVIYTTGHGNIDHGIKVLSMKGKGDGALPYLLDNIPYGKRTIIMDQCYGGSWIMQFIDDPRTLFIAEDRDWVDGNRVAPYFWSDNLIGPNGNGHVLWWQRFAKAVYGGETARIEPIFAPTWGYFDNGVMPFKPKVKDVKDQEELQHELSKLEPGQFAFVASATVFSGAYFAYRPIFEMFAKEAKGQYLFLMVNNDDATSENLSEATVDIVDYKGRKYRVNDKLAALTEIDCFYLHEEECRFREGLRKLADNALESALAAAKSVKDFPERSSQMRKIAEAFLNAGFEARAAKISEDAEALSYLE